MVQLYTHQQTSRDTAPVKQLRAFQRVHLAPGETTTVRLHAEAADLALWDVTRGRVGGRAASHDILVGASSTEIRQRTTVRVHGENIPAAT